MSVITEYKVIDLWHDSNLVFTNKNKPDVLKKFLCRIFADVGLELTEFSSLSYRNIRRRCERIIEKIKANKKHSKSKYDGFDPEKIFFRQSEFPELFKKDVPNR